MIELDFKPKGILKNGHLNTICSNLLRQVSFAGYTRRRVELLDGDFIDLDTILEGRKTCVLLMHGLEGDSHRPYMLGMAKKCLEIGYDVIAMNHRGCSGEPNRLLTAYHGGKIDDLETILEFVETNFDFDNVIICGFSLSGNLLLKYVGERGEGVSKLVKACVAISVPCDLASSAYQLKKGFNKVYMARFMKTIKAKAFQKLETFSDAPFAASDIKNAKTFHDFDEFYTSRVHGFNGAHDYWQKCSSKPFIETIRVPTLIINAQDDPFLSLQCFPIQECAANGFVELKTPKYGGHVGFIKDFKMKSTYAEESVVEFLQKL